MEFRRIKAKLYSTTRTVSGVEWIRAGFVGLDKAKSGALVEPGALNAGEKAESYTESTEEEAQRTQRGKFVRWHELDATGLPETIESGSNCAAGTGVLSIAIAVNWNLSATLKGTEMA